MSARALRRVAKAMVAMRADVEGGAVQEGRNGTKDLEGMDGAKREHGSANASKVPSLNTKIPRLRIARENIGCVQICEQGKRPVGSKHDPAAASPLARHDQPGEYKHRDDACGKEGIDGEDDAGAQDRGVVGLPPLFFVQQERAEGRGAREWHDTYGRDNFPANDAVGE